VPGEVTLVVDIRSPAAARVDEVEAAIREAIASVAERSRVDAVVRHVVEIPVTEFDEACRDAVTRACRHLGLTSLAVVSGAGHDAMSIARIAPSALVFIPCRDGVSHHPDEYSTPDQVGAGCDAILHAVLERAGLAAPA
jgi:N-carbamoyl-L-amino-acid hydrolase